MVAALPEWEHNELPLREQLQGSKLRLSIRRYEPVGVVAAITPYNFPFITNVWKVMPALATGMHGRAAAEPAHAVVRARLRRGGRGSGPSRRACSTSSPRAVPRAGSSCRRHPGVDLVSFTGSITVGRSIAAQAAPTLKRVILELGGQERAAPPARRARRRARRRGGAGGDGVHRARGQGCALQTRMLVPHDKKAEVLDAVGAAAERMPPADPHEASTMVGPLITEAHRGARRRPGRRRPRRGRAPRRGWPPARAPRTRLVLLADRRRLDDNANPLAQREVFGPGHHRAGLRRRRRSRRHRQRQRVRAVGRRVHRRPRARAVDRGADPLRDRAGEHVGGHLVHADGRVQAERHRARAWRSPACGSSRSSSTSSSAAADLPVPALT